MIRLRRRALASSILLLAGACGLAEPAVAASGPRLVGAAEGHDETRSFNRALGVECIYCHQPAGSAAPPRPEYLFAERMVRMVRGLNAGPLQPFGGVTCWTCHRGVTRPRRLPREKWEAVQSANASVFVGPREGHAITMSVYAASLGAKCDLCHEQSSWAGDSKRAKSTARSMVRLFDEIPAYFEAARMPRLQCFMCHQGERTPERAPVALPKPRLDVSASRR